MACRVSCVSLTESWRLRRRPEECQGFDLGAAERKDQPLTGETTTVPLAVKHNKWFACSVSRRLVSVSGCDAVAVELHRFIAATAHLETSTRRRRKCRSGNNGSERIWKAGIVVGYLHHLRR